MEERCQFLEVGKQNQLHAEELHRQSEVYDENPIDTRHVTFVQGFDMTLALQGIRQENMMMKARCQFLESQHMHVMMKDDGSADDKVLKAKQEMKRAHEKEKAEMTEEWEGKIRDLDSSFQEQTSAAKRKVQALISDLREEKDRRRVDDERLRIAGEDNTRQRQEILQLKRHRSHLEDIIEKLRAEVTDSYHVSQNLDRIKQLREELTVAAAAINQ